MMDNGRDQHSRMFTPCWRRRWIPLGGKHTCRSFSVVLHISHLASGVRFFLAGRCVTHNNSDDTCKQALFMARPSSPTGSPAAAGTPSINVVRSLQQRCHRTAILETRRSKDKKLIIGSTTAAALVTFAVSLTTVLLAHYAPGAEGQHHKYMNGKQWKTYLNADKERGLFEHWDRMIQPRIDTLATLVEEEGDENSQPYLVTMVGDSTMMQQHGVVCAYLAERPGRRFDPADHNDQCCIDTLPRNASEVMPTEPDIVGSFGTSAQDSLGKGEGVSRGGRGLCFRHAYQKFATPPNREDLGPADAVYFGSGLHFLHMCRMGHPLEDVRVQGWLRYEADLAEAVNYYRHEGGPNFRLVFMTAHTIEDSRYTGEFDEVLTGYRDNNATVTSFCENQVHHTAAGEQGMGEYKPGTYCRRALLSRSGSDTLNERARGVMAGLRVPLVEGDLIVRDQTWATPPQDGRHYARLVPLEAFTLLGVLSSPYAKSPQPKPKP